MNPPEVVGSSEIIEEIPDVPMKEPEVVENPSNVRNKPLMKSHEIGQPSEIRWKSVIRRPKKILRLVSWHYGERIHEILKMKYFHITR